MGGKREWQEREGRRKGREGSSLRARALAAGIGGEGWVGWGSERPCSRTIPGEGFAAHTFFSSYFYKILDSK